MKNVLVYAIAFWMLIALPLWIIRQQGGQQFNHSLYMQMNNSNVDKVYFLIETRFMNKFTRESWQEFLDIFYPKYNKTENIWQTYSMCMVTLSFNPALIEPKKQIFTNQVGPYTVIG